MKIKESTYLVSSPSFDLCPKPDRPEYAFIGRSNVGKSSLINMICEKRALAKISATPGKTQLINHFNIMSVSNTKDTPWYLVDLPGYGYAKTAQRNRNRWEQMIENYLRKRENLMQVFVLVDGRHAPQAIDLEFIANLGKWEIPFALVFTKSDKEKPGVVQRNVEAFLNEMRSKWHFLPQHFVTSSEKRIGRDEILDLIERLNNEAYQD